VKLLAFLGGSVRRKTMAVVLAIAFVALLVNAVVLVIYDVRTYQAARLAEARAQAQILGRAAAPALAFNDRKEANAALASLRASGDVVAAALYTPDGRVFASYAPERKQAGEVLRVSFEIVEGGQRLGAVEVVTHSGLRERILAYAGILVAVMVVALGAALLLSAWLQRVLTEPILDIDAAARSVVDRRDYTVRARRTTDDEIGVLADAFNRMLAEVEASHGELREADRRKDEFLATLAHELRNPLAPVRNALFLLREVPPGDPAAGEARAMIERQVDQMVRLIDDLIDVSRITTGKLALRRERVDVGAVARSALEAAEPAVRARRHALEVSLPRAPVYVSADATRLAQVVLNLLNNACKFTEPGGHIVFEVRLEGETLLARVRDDGIGIAPQQLQPIFQMFNQADRSLERTAGGLGVGLALSRRLVELHGGTIEARSGGEGQGAEFIVRIPAGGVPAERGSTSEGHAARRGNGPRRILLVDDNADFADSLAAVLRGIGNEVRVERDGAAGLAAAAQFRPDFAFLDIGMPGMNGFDLARRLREQPETRATILVAITGFSQPADRQRGKEAGFDRYLIKPVEVEQVKEIVAG
jgi:signal transduction histidine kinase